MAANAKLNYNFQQHKYGIMPKSDEMAVSQDMHLKMSKKIAQLTKVIYALNTKNDEHDAIVSAIELRHTAHVAQLLEESRHRVLQLESKVKSEVSSSEVSELRRRLSKHDDERERFVMEMKAYKDVAEQRDSEHAEKLATLMLALEDNQRRLLENDTEVVRLRTECAVATAASEAQHRVSLTSVKSEHEAQLAELQVQLEAAQRQLGDTLEDSEAKMAKTRAFYENELAMLTHANDTTADQKLEAAIAKANGLERDLEHERTQAAQRVAGLVEQLSVSEEHNGKVLHQMEALKRSLKVKTSEATDIENKLKEARKTISKLQLCLLETNKDVSDLRDSCEQQKCDILTKSTAIAALEATKLQNDTQMMELKKTVTRLQAKLNSLEVSRKASDTSNQSASNKLAARICELQECLEESLGQKQAMEKRHEDELQTLCDTQEGAVKKIMSEHEAKMVAILKENSENIEKQRVDSKKALDSLREQSEQKLSDEACRLTAELTAARQEYEVKIQQLSAQLTDALHKVEVLEQTAEESAKGVGSATSQIDNLKGEIARLKVTLDETNTQLKNTKAEMAREKAEHEKLKLQHENKMKEATAELKNKLRDLTKAKDDHWAQKMSTVMEALRSELATKSESEKRTALTKLAISKDEELSASRLGWENKVKELLEEISVMKVHLDSLLATTGEQLAGAQAELASQREELLQRLADAERKMETNMELCRQSWEERLQVAMQEKEAALTELESVLTSRHMEAMQAQLMGYRVKLDAARSAADKERERSLEAEKERHRLDMERLETESRHRQADELERMNLSHEEQLAAARLQLDRALEVGRQQEAEHAMQMGEMEEDLHRHEERMKRLNVDLDLQHKAVDDMSQELEAKGREILAIRSESNELIRTQVSQLQESHLEEINELKLQTMADTTKMLSEFSEAQDLLKDKISQLQNMIEEAEERYQNRESRCEDIDAIASLQAQLETTCREIQKLMDEKRFFQMELVNRETNFNKVFGATPQVGVINPLASKRTKSEQKVQGMKFQNSPSGISRLDPIPGSPVHDGRFNHIRPLPPAIKKPIK